jgi:predicted enzyme related to lactoylglutathione lyase
MTGNHIDYIEFSAPDLKAIKTFYSSCFGWKFTDFGPDYTAFEKSGVSGGTILQEIFSLPGGKRFHFSDPAGNELAVWSDQ